MSNVDTQGPPDRIADRYEVIAPLGRGGMATTYLVRDLVDGTRLALKLLHSDHPSMIEALRFEFRTLQSLHHAYLCPVHDFGFLHPDADHATLPHATCFYTAEAIDGVTLDTHAKDRPWKTAVRPLLHALEALRLLHRVGVRHGDFKPGNILVRRDGTGVLVDLGCARPIDLPPTTQVSGTRAFLAPELLRGEASDARADLFAVGVTLQRLASVTKTQPPKSHRRLIERLTDPEPNQRPQSVDEVLEAMGTQPTPIPPASTWRGRFVGRDAQLATAQRALDALLSNKAGPRVLCVTGPPGVGRTRLLQEIEWQTQPRCRVVRASSSALVPVEDMLSRALRSPVAPGDLPIVDAMRDLSRRDDHVVLVFDDVQRLIPTHRQRLAAVARLLEPTSPILLIVSTTPPCSLEVDALQELPTAPLTPTDLGLWLAPTFGETSIAAFARLTGGYPDALNAVIGLLRAGQRTEEDLARMADGVALDERRAQLLHALPAPQLRAVGLVALLGGQISGRAASELRIRVESLRVLRDAGFLERHAWGWKMTRAGESAPLVHHLPPAEQERLHGELARWLQRDDETGDVDDATRSERLANVALHLALANRRNEAESLIRARADEHERAPNAWFDAIVALLDGVDDADPPIDLVLDAARLERTSGRARDALARLSALENRKPTGRAKVRLLTEIGACHAALGDVQRAEEDLQHALRDATDPKDRLRTCTALARVQVRRGAYARARDTTHIAHSPELPLADRVELLALEGMANSFLGDAKAARKSLQEAIDALAQEGQPLAQVRAVTSLALHNLREGDLEEASRGLEQGLRISQEHGFAHHIANLSLNLGVVHLQRGAWHAALAAYDKGWRVAKALSIRSTEATLLCNLAKAHADLGAFERAQQLAERGRELATRMILPLAVAAADTVLAEVEQARGQSRDAASRLMAARAAFAASDSVDELTEVELQLAELAALQQDPKQAKRWLRTCTERLDTSESKYLAARLSLARARVLEADHNPDEALRWAEDAVDAFAAANHRDAEAEARLLLAELATNTGAPHLAQQHLSLARALWERAAASLTAAEREAFWRHPKRARARVTDIDAPSLTSEGDSRMRRLLEINKRLNSSLRTEDVLRATMDAAVELTGAERGFVLLQQPSKKGRQQLSVAVARNVDREQVGRSHLKFSRSIAQNVVRTGQAMLSTDAASDGRFQDDASVHAMHLKSVACVPIHSPDGVLGALYLDNRFQRGRFSRSDVELLLAFADQVALALRNARLMDALQRRNEELEAERGRVQQLAEGQAAEIDRLHEQVRETRRSLARKYDYARIVGTSEPMQRVFDVLDRVTDTTIPVLVQGESGTGKELIARALHYNGPRRDHRLVSINCAALPEPLLESELFGHVRGAFTGAERDRDGLVFRAAGGTLFLDEVGDLPLSVQAKLLRVLQEREVLPIGASQAKPVDFRLVCATNRGLREEVDRGAFRQDLYYRIAVVEIQVPPLRDRSEDIPPLVDHILRNVAEQTEGDSPTLSAAALRKLIRSPWPGNVRQLENVLTRAVLLARGDVIQPSDIELPELAAGSRNEPGRGAFERDEKARILQMLEAHRWNVRKVAPLLGLPRSTLYRKLKRYGIAVRNRGGETNESDR